MFESSNRWDGGILLYVDEGVNVIIKHMSPLVDSEVVACQFVF